MPYPCAWPGGADSSVARYSCSAYRLISPSNYSLRVRYSEGVAWRLELSSSVETVTLVLGSFGCSVQRCCIEGRRRRGQGDEPGGARPRLSVVLYKE
eukprot:SAG25_NODE_85_length_16527_cov_73.409240_10_plen_97_part_00